MFARLHIWLRVLPVLPLVGACAVPTGPDIPDRADPFEPPAIYASWWRLTEACSGRRSDFRAVQWRVMRGVDRLPGRQGVVAAWFPRGNQIVLTEGARLDGTLVRHEMLHALLGKAGGDHPREEFIGACGGVVACSGECETEAGPPALAPSAKRVDPFVLSVDATVFPSTPSASIYDGHFHLIITARHTGPDHVEVELPDAGVAGLKIGPDFVVRGSGTPIKAWAPVRAPETARFAPGETKRYVFDFRVGQRNQFGQVIPAGTWTFNGAFGNHWDREPPVVTIGP